MVQFTGNFSVDSELFGINFEAKYKEVRILCKVSIEALQDIDPQHARCTPNEQYLKNRQTLEEIARRKIERGEGRSGVITIGTKDLP